MNGLATNLNTPTTRDDCTTSSTPKKQTTLSSICSVEEYQAMVEGHTAHFVSDRITLLIGPWKVLSAREHIVWSQMMVLSRAYKSLTIRVTHRQLYAQAGTSEATMRDALQRLSEKGFIKIRHKNITQFGKEYVIQMGIPKQYIPTVKADLDRCRSKNPEGVNYAFFDLKTARKNTFSLKNTDQTECTHTQKPDDKNPVADVKPSYPEKEYTHTTALAPDEASFSDETVYLSKDHQRLSKTEAYATPNNQDTLTAPYQPRQNRPKNWCPSAEDYAFLAGPEATPPKNQAEQHRVFDIVDWMAHLKFKVQKTAFEKEGNNQSFGRFLMTAKHLDQAFSAHLENHLPTTLKPLLPKLLAHLKAYQDPYASAWFPLTQGMLQQQQQEYKSALTKALSEQSTARLSPKVAVCLPVYWYNQVRNLVKRLKLSEEKVLELSYHIEHYRPDKPFKNLEALRRFNLCLAIRLIKDRRWRSPLGLRPEALPSNKLRGF